ncbi:MAG: DNA-3-methyladenine glycosylase 2 family protein [Pseudomonadota bacterium]
MRILDASNMDAAWAALRRACPRLGAALDQVGPPELRRRPEGFASMLQVIVDQQVSVASGRAIWARVEAAGATSAAAVSAMEDEALRACGLSRPKVRAARALAEAERSGALCFRRQREARYEEAAAELTAVKGVGPWSAAIYHMFCVGRADMMPAADIAIQEAVRRLYGLPERPDAKALDAMAEAWAPWRSAAALLLWRYYLEEKSRDGVR